MPIRVGQPVPDIVFTSNAWEVAEKMGVLEDLLVPVLMTSMSQSLDVLQNAIVNSMYRLFEFNPRPSTGVLEGGFYQTVMPMGDASSVPVAPPSPSTAVGPVSTTVVPMPATTAIVGELINPVAYAWRRQAGFDGMTDSLGRTYQQDPHFRGSLDYMGRGLRNTKTRKRIRELFQEGLDVAMVGMGVVP